MVEGEELELRVRGLFGNDVIVFQYDLHSFLTGSPIVALCPRNMSGQQNLPQTNMETHIAPFYKDYNLYRVLLGFHVSFRECYAEAAEA